MHVAAYAVHSGFVWQLKRYFRYCKGTSGTCNNSNISWGVVNIYVMMKYMNGNLHIKHGPLRCQNITKMNPVSSWEHHTSSPHGFQILKIFVIFVYRDAPL